MKKSQILSLLFATAILAFIVWFSPDVPGLTKAGKAALGTAAFAIVIWVTGAVEDALSGLIIVFLLAALKAGTLGNAFGGFANTALWLLVVGFIMAACMEKTGLSKRIALYMVNLAGGSAVKTYWAVALVMLITTFLVPSISARTLLMLPILLEIGSAFGAKKGESNILKALMLIVIMSGTMMSIGVLTAHAGNPITAGLIESASKQVISWSQWFKVGGPPAFTLAAISIYVIQRMYKPEVERLGSGEEYIRHELEALGSLKKEEKYTLVVFLITLVLWATDSLHGVAVIIVGMLSIIALLWPGANIMPWKVAQTKVPWNVFILYGAGLSMGSVLLSSGAAKWLALTFFSPIAVFTQSMQLVILIWVVTVLQVFFTGGGPKTTALTPIVIAHAVAIGADPLVFALIIGMNMQHQYLLPVTNMPNAIMAGTGHLSSNDITKAGAVMSILACTFMSIMVFTYWNWLGIVK
ncbi:MAG: DASS family sodium-coupled anion symporter [Acidaminococcaceae bacterium]